MFPFFAPLELPLLPEPAPIVNGEEVEDPAEVVLLTLHNEAETEFAICTGSQIAAGWVLTAAHCVESGEGITVEVIEVSWVDRLSGVQSFNTRQAAAWYPHPQHNAETGEYDAALVELAEPRDGEFMRLSAEGPRARDQGEDVVLIGFGATSDDDESEPIKRSASVPLLDHDDLLLYTFDGLDEQNACFGDSGGPVLRYDEEGGLVQAGVIDFVSGCVGGGMGAARVDAVADFISGYTTDPEWVEGNWSAAPEADDAEAPDDGSTSGLLPGKEDKAACSSASAGAAPILAGLGVLAAAFRRRAALGWPTRLRYRS